MMSRLFSGIAALIFVAGLGSMADAKTCHGKDGKFIKCPPAMKGMKTSSMVSKPDKKGHCHGAGGKFVKCPKM